LHVLESNKEVDETAGDDDKADCNDCGVGLAPNALDAVIGVLVIEGTSILATVAHVPDGLIPEDSLMAAPRKWRPEHIITDQSINIRLFITKMTYRI